jgi:membrane protease YdiL (CAAX protease family)
MRSVSVAAPSPRSRRPIMVAIALLVGFELVAVGMTLVLDRVTGLDGKARDLTVEAVLAAGVVGLIAALAWWRSTGFTTPMREWRNRRLLVLPLGLTLLPFLGGVRNVDIRTIGLLVVGYALNSLAEDGMFRGIMPRVLRSRGLLVAVVLSSFLFGLAHFGNIISRPDQSVAITAAQALGAFTEGIGLVAVRLAMDTIWPVMLVHFLGDLFGQLGGLPVVLSNVIGSTVMLVFGIWVYRRHRSELELSLLTADVDPAAAVAGGTRHDGALGG